jgi:hypothetical protein
LNDVKRESPEQEGPNTEEVTDRLIEKVEKLNYFLVTASTAVLVFTFNDFNSSTGLLQSSPVLLVAFGWAFLIMSSVASLLVVRDGHELYRIYIKLRNQRLDQPPPETQRIVQRLYARTRFLEITMIGGFLLGIAVLASAYIAALTRS